MSKGNDPVLREKMMLVGETGIIVRRMEYEAE